MEFYCENVLDLMHSWLMHRTNMNKKQPKNFDVKTNMRGGLKATASDVAELAGVSKWTVSRAFTEGASISVKARTAVLKAAKALEYRPNLLARGLAKKCTHIIGVAIDELKNPHSIIMLDVVTRQLQARGYTALLLNITEGENYRSVMMMAEQLQVDGMLFLGTQLTDEMKMVVQSFHHIPLVQVFRNAELSDVDCVANDGYQAGYQIANLLLAQGYTRFGYMKGPNTHSSHLLRMDGFQDGLLAGNQQLELLLTTEHYEQERAYVTMNHYLHGLLGEPPIDALFCENDVLALGVMDALREANVKIAVVGFDDIDEAARPSRQLTSVSQNRELLVAEALNRLIDGVANPDGPWREGKLCLRRSHLKR